MCVCESQSLSHGRFFATPWTVAHPWTVPPTLQTFLFLQHNTFFSPLKTFLLAVLSPSNSHTLQQESESEVAQSCPTLCNPMDCSPPGSSIHGIFQARVLEWVAISFSRGIFLTQGLNPDPPALLTDSLPSEPPGKPLSRRVPV